MKTLIRMMVIGLALVWGTLPAAAQGAGHITVTGEAEVLVPPDEVVLTLGVETWNDDLKAAKSENDVRVQRILDLAARTNIEPRHVQTDFVHIEPRWELEYEHKKFLGYFVQKTVVVTLKDVSSFEEFLSAAMDGPANYVHGIDFRTTELRKHRDQARTLAIRAAQEKAVAMATELGQKVGRPTEISEDRVGWWSSYGSWWGSRGSAMTQNVIQSAGEPISMGEGVAAGQISVQARVSVSFELE